MRCKFLSSASTLLVGVLLVVSEVAANPDGVPVPESPPLSCSTTYFTVTLNSAASATCPVTSSSACTKYDYTIAAKNQGTGPNVDHTVFAVAATQDLNATNPAAFTSVPGAGDNTTGFLAGAFHEYAVRFNSGNSKSVNAQIFISGPSKPRVGTVLVRSGTKILESCQIATPGISGDVFQPVFQAQTALVAGGKCLVNLTFDGFGNVIDVNPAAGSSCIKYEGPVTVTIGNNTGPLRNNTSPHGLTFGDGTTTCYGPPVPSVPKCVCTKLPCP